TRPGSNDSSDDIDMQKLEENIHVIQVSCKICKGAHLTQECPLRKEDEAIKQIKYIGSLEETINKYCEESIKRQAAIDEWIRKFIENTDLKLRALDAKTKNLHVKADQLTQAILTNHMVDKVKTKMKKVKEVKKEPIPFDLPIVNPYVVPTVPLIPWRLKKHVVEPYITRKPVCVIRFSKETNEEKRSCVMKTNVELETFIQQVNPLHM
ncbi:hypothetical protein Tco_0304529, partial [Tanacetum coccineum]